MIEIKKHHDGRDVVIGAHITPVPAHLPRFEHWLDGVVPVTVAYDGECVWALANGLDVYEALGEPYRREIDSAVEEDIQAERDNALTLEAPQ